MAIPEAMRASCSPAAGSRCAAGSRSSTPRASSTVTTAARSRWSRSTSTRESAHILARETRSPSSSSSASSGCEIARGRGARRDRARGGGLWQHGGLSRAACPRRRAHRPATDGSCSSGTGWRDSTLPPASRRRGDTRETIADALSPRGARGDGSRGRGRAPAVHHRHHRPRGHAPRRQPDVPARDVVGGTITDSPDDARVEAVDWSIAVALLGTGPAAADRGAARRGDRARLQGGEARYLGVVVDRRAECAAATRTRAGSVSSTTRTATDRSTGREWCMERLLQVRRARART